MCLRHFKGNFSTPIHICVQNNFIGYAFEGHINVGLGAASGPGGRLLDSPALYAYKSVLTINILQGRHLSALSCTKFSRT